MLRFDRDMRVSSQRKHFKIKNKKKLVFEQKTQLISEFPRFFSIFFTRSVITPLGHILVNIDTRGKKENK